MIAAFCNLSILLRRPLKRGWLDPFLSRINHFSVVYNCLVVYKFLSSKWLKPSLRCVINASLNPLLHVTWMAFSQAGLCSYWQIYCNFLFLIFDVCFINHEIRTKCLSNGYNLFWKDCFHSLLDFLGSIVEILSKSLLHEQLHDLFVFGWFKRIQFYCS